MNSEKNKATPLMREKKALMAFALKIKYVPPKFADGNGKISEAKIIEQLIAYHSM